MEDTWLQWAKRLQGLASTGLHYCRDEFDRERYAEIAGIANEMLARLGDVPLGRIEGLVPDFAEGYATPKVDVRGAVFDDDKVLLVREASDGLWTLPGGFAEIGTSPAENVEKEIREEACLDVAATAVYGIRHKARHPYPPDSRDIYKLFFLCERRGNGTPKAGHETTAVGYFSLGDLPALSTARVLEQDIAAAFAYRANPDEPLLFD